MEDQGAVGWVVVHLWQTTLEVEFLLSCLSVNSFVFRHTRFSVKPCGCGTGINLRILILDAIIIILYPVGPKEES